MFCFFKWLAMISNFNLWTTKHLAFFFQDFLLYKTIVSHIFAWNWIEFFIRIPSRWFTMASIKNSNEKTWKFYAWVKKCDFVNFSERLICHFLTFIWILNFFVPNVFIWSGKQKSFIKLIHKVLLAPSKYLLKWIKVDK